MGDEQVDNVEVPGGGGLHQRGAVAFHAAVFDVGPHCNQHLEKIGCRGVNITLTFVYVTTTSGLRNPIENYQQVQDIWLGTETEGSITKSASACPVTT